MKSLSRVQLFVTPWTVYQAPLSMGFSRQECWSGLPFPSPGDLPDTGIEPGSSALQADTYRLSHQGSPSLDYLYLIQCKCYVNSCKYKVKLCKLLLANSRFAFLNFMEFHISNIIYRYRGLTVFHHLLPEEFGQLPNWLSYPQYFHSLAFWRQDDLSLTWNRSDTLHL